MFSAIKNKTKAFAEAKIKLLTLEIKEKAAGFIAAIIPVVVIVILGFFFLVFGSITLSLYLNQVLNSIWMGFGIVTAFYLLLLIIVIMVSRTESFKKMMVNKLVNAMIESEN